MKATGPIEIELIRAGNSEKYLSLGYLVDSQEGYFYYWPKQDNADKTAWLKVFEESDIIVQLYLIGSLARTDSRDHLSAEMIEIIQQKERLLLVLAEKYFHEFQDGLLIKQDDVILDLEYGRYNTHSNGGGVETVEGDFDSEDEEEYDHLYKRHYADGLTIHILNRAISWDEMTDNAFIEGSSYYTLMHDIAKFVNLLR
jgi:hypothetical protein